MQTACSKSFTAPQGIINSPSKIVENLFSVCNYKIFAPKGKVIQLKFDFFNLTSLSRYASDCSYGNYLRIYDGIPTEDHVLGMYCRPINEPSTIISKFNEIQIDLVSTSSSSGSFRANYSFIDACKFIFSFTCNCTSINCIFLYFSMWWHST